MAFNYSPKIVTDGLVLCLDAGNPNSYPGSGNTWKDLSRGRNNGTLTNGPTFDSGNGGYINFDGSNDTVLVYNIPTNTNSLEGNTIEQWLYWNGVNGDMPFSWFDITFDMFFSSGGFGINNGASLVYGTSNTGLSNIWFHYACFFPNNWATRSGDAKLWINGIEKSMTVFNGSFANKTIPSLATVSIGSGYNNSIGAYAFGGKIATTKIYNKELTSTEILQNYNATKGRFGL